MKKSIYRDGGVIKWSMTIGEAIDAFKSMPKKRSSTVLSLNGPKGVGKSSILELISLKTDLVCVEGDIMTMLGIALHEGADSKVKIADFAKTDPTPWAKYKGKDEEKSGFVKKHLGPYLGAIDVTTGFHGSNSLLYGVVWCDYKTYVDNLTLRIKEMTKGEGSFESHVKSTHKVLSFDELTAYYKKTYYDNENCVTIQNSSDDSIIINQIVDLVNIASGKF